MIGCASDDQYRAMTENLEEVQAMTIQKVPAVDPLNVAPENRSVIQRGKYLVELLGCGTCHTDGALTGEPTPGRSLAGSRIGIAYSSPLLVSRPGVIFPPNITSDIQTGIGGWNIEQLRAAIRMGEGRHSSSKFLVMPWPGFSRLSDGDTDAIASYLKNLQPVEHRVPNNVPAGEPTNEAFVYFGIYRTKN